MEWETKKRKESEKRKLTKRFGERLKESQKEKRRKIPRQRVPSS